MQRNWQQKLSERGSAYIEYAILLWLIAVICIVALMAFRGDNSSSQTDQTSTTAVQIANSQ